MKIVTLGLVLLAFSTAAFAQTYCPAAVNCSSTLLNSCSQEPHWQLDANVSYTTQQGQFPLIEVVAKKEANNKHWQITCQYGVPSQESVKLVYTNSANQSLAPEVLAKNTDWYPLAVGLFGCDSAHGSEAPPAVKTVLCPLAQRSL